MRDDALYLEFIKENIRIVERRLAGAAGSPDENLFYDDLEKQDAALRRMDILSDAASRLSDELQTRHPDIDWRKITNFRNVRAHGYIDVELDRVWAAIVDDLPALRAVIDQELSESGG